MTLNPFLKLHFNLAGGRNKLLIAVGFYALLIVGGWYAGYRFSLIDRGANAPIPTDAERALIASQVSAGTLGWVGGSQALFLLLLAPLAIRKAVTNDYTSGMLESHRLTPMSGLKVALGYLTAAPIQAYCLYLAALVLGCIFSVDMARGLSIAPEAMLRSWFGAQAALLTLALAATSITLLFSLHSPGKRGVPIILLLAFGGSTIVRFVPAIALAVGLSAAQIILSTFTGRPLIGMNTGAVMVGSMVVQLAFALLFIAAAARKIRVVQGSLFSVLHGVLLVVLFGVATIVAIWATGTKSGVADFDSAAAQIGISLGAMIIFAYSPLAAAAEEQSVADRAASFGEHQAPHRRRWYLTMPPLLALLLLATLCGALYVCPAAADSEFSAAVLRRTANGALPLAFLLMFICDFAILARVIRSERPAIRAMIFWFVILRALPLIFDGVRAAATTIEQTQPAPVFADSTFLTPLSPIGTMIMCLMNEGNPWPGVAAQALITALFVWYWWRGRPAPAAAVARPLAA